MNTVANFAVIGVAGFVARRHVRAIKDIGAKLVLAYDPVDSVGYLDAFFPEAVFTTRFEKFDDLVSSLKGTSDQIEYIAVCSPNYLHLEHVSYAIRNRIKPLCEKPLVTSLNDYNRLRELSSEYGIPVSVVFQLRLHPSVIALEKKIRGNQGVGAHHVVELTYVTSRGNWYQESWKSNDSLSGGIMLNIGVHFFDLLCFLFGVPHGCELFGQTDKKCSGLISFPYATVRWLLSIDAADLPLEAAKGSDIKTHRMLKIDGEEFEFTTGFENLHTTVYTALMNDSCPTIDDAQASLAVINSLRLND